MSIANASYNRNNFGADGNSYPRFFVDAVQDMVASEREGRPIFRDEERVEIIMPGNPHTRPVARVTQEHKDKWPEIYKAFKAGIEVSPEGTPLEQWPILSKAQVLELKALGFTTVEHVRDMDDLAIQRIRLGGRRLKEIASVFLDDANRIAETSRLAAENERKDERIAILERQVAELGSRFESTAAELRASKDAPSPLATDIPGLSDPVALAKAGQPVEAGTSSLDGLAAPRKKVGRPTLPRDGDGNIIREAS